MTDESEKPVDVIDDDEDFVDNEEDEDFDDEEDDDFIEDGDDT